MGKYVRVVLVSVLVGLLLLGCGDGHDHHHEEPGDDFVVSVPSPLETFIERESGGAFDLLEIGVTPFTDQFGRPELYILTISGIAAFDGREIVFEAEDFITQERFFNPLGEPVLNVLITCDCFIDYVVLRDEFGDITIPTD